MLLGGTFDTFLVDWCDTRNVASKESPEVGVQSELVVRAVCNFTSVVHYLLDVVEDHAVFHVAAHAA